MIQFAFYGRVSTEDQQDPASSKQWQLHRSLGLIEPAGGEVVAEFFDIGQSRSLPWKRRPEAARLLSAIARPDRGFSAVVIGEPQRAFYGNQFGLTFPVFSHYGVQLWVPEVGGAVDPGSEAHDLVVMLFGGMSKGERMRIKTRVRTAMSAQAAMQGRFLGGRPPYGYRLADVGPHPNPAKAGDGKRLHQLEPDPATAPVVVRIFDEYLAGRGYLAIAERVTAEGIASPSGHDRERNRHRHGLAWEKSAIRVILTNPRYTGYQVWARQRREEVLLDVEDVSAGHQTIMRWNGEEQWVWSTEPSHEALVSTETFRAVQARMVDARRGSKPRRGPKSERPYLLRVGCDAACVAASSKATGTTARRTTAAATEPSAHCLRSSTTPRSFTCASGTSCRASMSASDASSIPTTSTTPATRSSVPLTLTRQPRTDRRRLPPCASATGSSTSTAAYSMPAPTQRSSVSGSPRCRPSAGTPRQGCEDWRTRPQPTS